MTESMIVIDVGSGTQDILLYQPEKALENCPKFIVPSRTQIVAAQIREATELRRGIFMHGHLMGGGACALAVRKHMAAGLKAYATPQVALTFNDNLALVERMGVVLCDKAPEATRPIWLGDIDPLALRQAIEAFGLEYPQKLAVAVQDHGFSITESNRTLRFRLWEEFVRQGGDLHKLNKGILAVNIGIVGWGSLARWSWWEWSFTNSTCSLEVRVLWSWLREGWFC